MTKRTSTAARKQKCRARKQCVERRALQKVSGQLKGLREQQNVRERTLSTQLNGLYKQQRVMQRELRESSTELRRLREDVRREVDECKRLSGEAHGRRRSFGQEAGEVLRDGMRYWIRGLLR